MLELAPEAIEAQIAQIRELFDFAQTLTLVPAETAGALRHETKELFEDLDRAYLDTILAASGAGRVLLCDDATFRGLAAEALPLKSIWSQAVLIRGLNQKLIQRDDYFRACNALAEGGYFFTSHQHREFYACAGDRAGV